MPEPNLKLPKDQKTLWNAKHVQYSSARWVEVPTIFAQQALPYFPPAGTLLEIGAGHGQDSLFFARQGYKVICTDFSQTALHAARERAAAKGLTNITFRAVDLSAPISFAANSADIVYSHLALHYFDENRTLQLFGELLNTLRPNGLLAILLNTIDDPEVSTLRRISTDLYETPEGFLKRYFSQESLRRFVL